MFDLILHDVLLPETEDKAIRFMPVFVGDKPPFPLKNAEYKSGCVTFFKARNTDEEDILLLGLGSKNNIKHINLRRAGGNAGRFLRDNGHSTAYLDPSFKASAEEIFDIIAGLALGTYCYKSQKNGNKNTAINLHALRSFVCEGTAKHVRSLCDGVFLARNLVNMPPNELYPASFAGIISDIFTDTDVKVDIYKGDELVNEGFVGTIAVGGGSKNPPHYIKLTCVSDTTKPHLVLIGKGVTFDMGGMNVKTGADLSISRMDMGGAAAVAGAMRIIQKQGLRANITALIPMAENLPSGSAFLPGAVLRYPDGTSVEICNTDCEGRLILADAMLHARRLNADTIIDIATLTIVGLGDRRAGIWGDDDLCRILIDIGEQTGDRLWQIPLVEEYEEYLKSDTADIKNFAVGKEGGSILAALILKHFIGGEAKWAHIDCASVVAAGTSHGFTPIGATGFGACMLAEFAYTYFAG